MITMKAIYFLTAIIGLQINTLFASNYSEGMIIKASSEILFLSELAPVIPAEADFSDEAPPFEMNFKSLAPVIPNEATFEEVNEPGLISLDILKQLAPAPSREADFEDLV